MDPLVEVPDQIRVVDAVGHDAARHADLIPGRENLANPPVPAQVPNRHLDAEWAFDALLGQERGDLARNRDDHTKNHAFLMHPDGTWVASPAYDLTYSKGPAGEHNLTLGGEGKNPGLKHSLAVARGAGIAEKTAGSVYDEVKASVDRWPNHALQAGLSDRRTAALDHALNGRGREPEPKELEVTSSPSP